MRIPIGVQVSTDNLTWYKLTDHNRQPISIKYDLVQNEQRMADGTLRKYIVARKFKITADWQDIPTLDSNLVDYARQASSSTTGTHTGSITSISADSGVVTYFTSSTPDIVGRSITISGASVSGYNGTFTTRSINPGISFSVTNSTTGATSTASLSYQVTTTISANAHGAAWIKAFYEANAFFPIWVKLIFAKDTIPNVGSVPSSSTYVTSEFSTGQTFNAYMSSFSYDIQKRQGSYDYVNCNIEFTEI